MNILLTCVGRRNYLVDYFKSELEPLGGKVYVANNHPNAAGFITADKAFVVPSVFNPLYIDVLIKICHQFNIRAIISLYDPELPILSKAKDHLAAEGILAIVSSPDVIEVCLDKLHANVFLQSCGICIPKTFQDKDLVLSRIRTNKINFPIILKPRWGNASLFLLEATSKEELNLYYSKIQDLIKKSTPFIINKGEPQYEQVIFQEKVNGQEYGLDVINDLNTNYMATIVKKKIAMRAGETDIAITENSPELTALGELISNKLGHIGNLDVDLFLSPTGPVVIDMNPRFGGGYPFSHLAGVNLPTAIISWLNNEPANPSNFDFEPNIMGMKGILPLKYDGGFIEILK